MQPPNRRATEARNASLMSNHVLPRFGDVSLVSIRRGDVQEWTHTLSVTLAPSTVAKCKELLGKVLAAAVEDGLIPQNPAAKVKLARHDDDQHELRVLTDAELWQLADVINPRYRAVVLIGGYGGLRIGELAGLRREDVDVLRGSLNIVEQVTDVNGVLQVGPLKTKKSRRTVGIPRAVADELAAHMAAYVGAEPDARVFTAPHGGLLSRSTFRWTRATRAAGLDGFRVHDLRHTAISLWIADGMNPKKIAARAGHTSVRTVFDVYGHLYQDDDRAELERADNRIAQARNAVNSGGQVIPLGR